MEVIYELYRYIPLAILNFSTILSGVVIKVLMFWELARWPARSTFKRYTTEYFRVENLENLDEVRAVALSLL